ncbi:MAG: Na(+)/H(+) antiporter subunit D [Syntrophales bacterium]|jgi:multicomponent Na+:H+ antiporter subunit D|nr:Na(+)/H(+) antiporter subunit D [Syntrophales bacterium]MDY0044549.1 Na(+)/H(+) antiporter subunit D [Syntrophales bacterium]
MINSCPPAFIFIIGAVIIPLLRGKTKSAFMLFLPILGFINLLNMTEGTYWILSFLNYNIIFGRVDKLSMVFGYIFTLISFIGVMYAIHLRDDIQHVSAFIYAGSALGVTYAGDFISLYIFWEMLAISSVFLIWARKTQKSLDAGFRYILVHMVGGLVLLAGILLYVNTTGTVEFNFIGLNGLGSWLILIGFALNAAIFPLHPWLTDAYPEATVTGAVFMSSFTTKSAVYILARTFPGTELLIWLGAFMTAFPIFYAVIANDIRRVLAYSLINQVGFMVCGIGIGTKLALNGTVSHAFCHILYKALLFMSAGSVLYVTGRIKCTQLGGLYKTMPLTAFFCIIGAASISAFPLFSGFVSKSMIINASVTEHLVIIWLVLQFASAGVFHHAGIKVPFFMFFGEDSGIRAKEPPFNMLLAMGIAAFFCVFIGIYPAPLYRILPFPVDYIPYTASHVVGQLQLLMFGALAFVLLILSGYYPAELRAINLDVDWFYRKGAKAIVSLATGIASETAKLCNYVFIKLLPAQLSAFSKKPVSYLLHLVNCRQTSTFTFFHQDIELSTRTPSGVPVMLAIIFLSALALIFFIA